MKLLSSYKNDILYEKYKLFLFNILYATTNRKYS